MGTIAGVTTILHIFWKCNMHPIAVIRLQVLCRVSHSIFNRLSGRPIEILFILFRCANIAQHFTGKLIVIEQVGMYQRIYL